MVIDQTYGYKDKIEQINDRESVHKESGVMIRKIVSYRRIEERYEKNLKVNTAVYAVKGIAEIPYP